MKTRYLWPLAAVLTACIQNVRVSEEPVTDTLADHSATRPEWVRKLPTQSGKMVIVTTSTEGLSAEAGLRVAKAYALAEFSEMMMTSVQVDSGLKTHSQMGTIQDTIAWRSRTWLRSMRLEDSYWEKRSTIEGSRYSVWALWSLPERAFYEAQQEQANHD